MELRCRKGCKRIPNFMNEQTTYKVLIIATVFLFLAPKISFAQTRADSVPQPDQFLHRLEIEARPGYIFPTNGFLRSGGMSSKPIRNSFSTHLKYSFQFRPDTPVGQIYGIPHQGIGTAFFTFGEPGQLGNPIAVYLFQGAQLAQFTPRLSLRYEWNFGLSGGWKPYHPQTNPENRIIGSKMNAYMNAGFYLCQTLSQHFDLIGGVSLTHFSNGNTQFPNAGLNTASVKLGLMYSFNRNTFFQQPLQQTLAPDFPRHVSYDVVLFGSWRRKGVYLEERGIASPHTYPVAGFNISPMYNFGYKLRAGLSLDGIYDSSANVYTEDYIIGYGDKDPGYTFYKPPVHKQLALGVSARAEYVMPYFTVGVGIGANIVHGGGDLAGLYQILALKVEVTKNSFIHIGYNLQNFQTPNYLMLGIGYRFNNRYPCLYR